MLFPYRFLENHTIYKLQKYIDFLVLEVWCTADQDIAYSIGLFENCPELKAIIKDFSFSDSTYGDLFVSTIQEVYGMLQSWDADELADLAMAYKNNNDIVGLCSKACTPRIYKEIEENHPELKKKLATFFKALFTNIIDLMPVKSRIGTIADHYREFVKLNDEDICPFCGINGMKNQYQEKREAYDHFLPKHIYPFNSVNFKNLAPMCHECNSSYKTVKEPIYPYSKNRDPLHKSDENRRRAFYPYAEELPNIKIEAELLSRDIHGLTPDKIQLTVKSDATHEEEIDAWVEVFGIEERYKASICSKNHVKYWYIQLVDELLDCQGEEERYRTLNNELKRLKRRAAKFPWADKNFLKWPFARACERAGVL